MGHKRCKPHKSAIYFSILGNCRGLRDAAQQFSLTLKLSDFVLVQLRAGESSTTSDVYLSQFILFIAVKYQVEPISQILLWKEMDI